MNISIVLPSLYGKEIIQKNFAYAPGPLADLLVRQLRKRGHKVTVFAPSGTRLPTPDVSEPIPFFEQELKRKKISAETYIHDYAVMFFRISEIIQLQLIHEAFQQAKRRKTDIIHFYCQQNYPAFYFAKLFSTPTLFTLHDPIPRKSDPKAWNRPGAFFPEMNFVTVSKNQQKSNNQLHYVGAVHNSVDISQYEFSDMKEPYLAWMARPSEYKGPDIAVRVGKATKMLVKLAGPKPLKSQMPFWKKNIEPSIKTKKAEFLGYIQGKQKNTFLKKASALLFPITWDEPFGMAMIEAMACGTPVIAFDSGAVREIINNGQTGFIVKNEQEMIAAIKKLHLIKPENCRRHVQENFSPEKMASAYEKIYKKLVR